MRYVKIFIAALFVSTMASAQLNVSINFNTDRQPLWGPSGYDRVEYYYLPDIEVYYNVPQRRFYYFERGRWISGSSLPSRYRGYDLYHSHKVVVNEPAPYRHHDVYRDKYASFKGRHDQEAIRDSRDERYFANKNHPQHNNWVKQQRHDSGRDKQNNGNGNSKGKGNGNGNGKDKGRGGNHGRD